jgi:hypothetical protein
MKLSLSTLEENGIVNRLSSAEGFLKQGQQSRKNQLPTIFLETFLAISVVLLVTFSTIGAIPILSAPFFAPSKRYSSLDLLLLEKL